MVSGFQQSGKVNGGHEKESTGQRIQVWWRDQTGRLILAGGQHGILAGLWEFRSGRVTGKRSGSRFEENIN
jgi:hypothetical protein